MAGKNDLLHSPLHTQIYRDGQGSDSSIPLSPQWLLPKPGENKTGTENHTSFPTFANRAGIVKPHGNNNDQVNDTQKKKDVFRPSMLENRERWRDEERETNFSVRKDRWREGDKDHVDHNRKVDRWTENSSGRYYGETRRTPSERLTDSGNKDPNHDQRRESKWNTRWGPDGKDTDSPRDKWTDVPVDKGLLYPNHPGKDEWETDSPKPWRSSSALSRGKVDPVPYQSPGSNKLSPMGRGRGRGGFEGNPMNNNNNYNTSIDSHAIPSFSDKFDRSHEESTFLRYSRSKLLDVYKVTGMRSSEKVLDGVMLVPSLTQEETLEPLALIAPTPEELFILKGIDKGDILSSGAPASQITKDGSLGRNGNSANPFYSKDGSKWQVNEDTVIKRQPSGHLEREQQETRILSQPNPEDMVLFYKDPQGAIQGPFTGTDIIGWFEAGYFGIDLLVRLANTPQDSPYNILGDVMPHLRAKARPPPGFSPAKQSEVNDQSSKSNFTNTMVKNEPRFQHGAGSEAENRFIESLISSNIGGGVSFSEGMQGYFGNSNSVPPDSGDNLYQLAKRIQLERQRSMSSPYSIWSGRDANATSVGPNKSDNNNILQDPITSTVNTGVTNWSNFPVHQRLPPQNQSAVTNLHGQGFDNNNPSGPLIPEKLLQEPQLLNLLQQQQHMLKPQGPIPTQQLSILDEYLLLKQLQQKQELQQLQLLRQQLLSQMLTDQHLGSKQSYGQMQTLDHLGFQQMGSQNQVPVIQDSRTNMPPLVSQSDNRVNVSETSLHWPHQMVEEDTDHQKGDDDNGLQDQTIEENVAISTSNDNEVLRAEDKLSNEPCAPKGGEVKTPSEKKSKKQKSSKPQSSASKTQQPKQSETEVNKVNEVEFVQQKLQDVGFSGEIGESKSDVATIDDFSQISEKTNEVVGPHNTQAQTVQRAWKPAPGFKPKSLLEIQQEEQWRAQAQAQAQVEMSVNDISTSLGSMNVSTPWVGFVNNSDHKESVTDASMNQKSKKGQMHDLLAGEVIHDPTTTPVTISQSDSIDDGAFKESKKSRKKSAKAKGNGAKAPVVEVPVSSNPSEKVKSSRQVSQDKDVPPAVPSGPSFGDFVVWKGETAGSTPAPAWSTDSGKIGTRASLRDILKEQEKKVGSSQHQTPVPTPQKPVPAQSTHGNGPPAKGAASSPIQINVSHVSTQSKNKIDDDLFWGPVDHVKQETKQLDFPQLAKKTPVKGISGGSLKSMVGGGRPVDTSLSSSPALKGKRDVSTKHSEAVDFRDWCESECVRLIGTKDTSFLEFCLKQSRSEAEVLLKENLGSYDRNHEFIDKFLNYKDFMPSDVLEIAFQKVPRDANRINDGAQDPENADGGPTKGGGKKKGKKGKKVSPIVLGFNVVSNRIMMGEIQTIED